MKELFKTWLLNRRKAYIAIAARVENATFCHIAEAEVEAIDKTLGIPGTVQPDADNTPERV